MPAIASKVTSGTYRAAKRRERRLARHGPRSLKFDGQRTLKRRGHVSRTLRDHASFDLESCFVHCQDAGFHRDPDVRIGSEASDTNAFGVLDPEASAPSLPFFTDTEFSFTCPPPCSAPAVDGDLTEENNSDAGVHLPLIDLSDDSGSKNATARSASPPLPSMPTTPPSKAKVRMPCNYPPSDHNTPPNFMNSNGTDYLQIKIPSPLLYHRRSREQLLTTSSDFDIGAELTKEFALNCGQDIPEPDFESYKVFDEALLRRRTTSPSGRLRDIVVPWADRMLERRQRLAFHNIPRPPWIVQLHEPEPIRSFVSPFARLSQLPPLPPSPPASPPILTTTNTFCINQLGIPSNDNAMPTTPQSSSAACDLVFPRLLAPPSRIIADTKRQSTFRKAITDFIDDNPEEVTRRWQAFEDAIKKPKPRNQVSDGRTITQIVEPKAKSEVLLPLRTDTLDLAACPTSQCLALVPAKLYQHQYIGWPLQANSGGSYKDVTYPIIGVKPAEHIRLANWAVDLGLETQHVPDCAAPESGSSSGLGLEEMFCSGVPMADPIETTHEMVSGEPSPSSTDSSTTPPSAHTTSESASMDEGYFTGESTVDVSHADVDGEEDWADWDWDEASPDVGIDTGNAANGLEDR